MKYNFIKFKILIMTTIVLLYMILLISISMFIQKELLNVCASILIFFFILFTYKVYDYVYEIELKYSNYIEPTPEIKVKHGTVLSLYDIVKEYGIRSFCIDKITHIEGDEEYQIVIDNQRKINFSLMIKFLNYNKETLKETMWTVEELSYNVFKITWRVENNRMIPLSEFFKRAPKLPSTFKFDVPYSERKSNYIKIFSIS